MLIIGKGRASPSGLMLLEPSLSARPVPHIATSVLSTTGAYPTAPAALSKVPVPGERAGPNKTPTADCPGPSPRGCRGRRTAAGTREGPLHPTAPQRTVWFRREAGEFQDCGMLGY